MSSTSLTPDSERGRVTMKIVALIKCNSSLMVRLKIK